MTHRTVSGRGRISGLLALISLSSVITLAFFAPRFRAEGAPPPPPDGSSAPPRIIAWNDLGMHCLDPDFSVFSILPPYNTVNAHVMVGGQIRGAAEGYSVEYEGIADPNGSINTTSIGKSNFWDHVNALFGVTLPLDVGLAGHAMPGLANVAQPMTYIPAQEWFQGEGIPMTPIDDAGQKNPYPMMKITARNASGQVVASTVTTVPNSQELDCKRCHGSAGNPAAMPAQGWVFHPDPLKDDRLNILALHDDRQLGQPQYQAALAVAGYNPNGLLATVLDDATSILCAKCHASNALIGTGQPGISTLTTAIHGLHGGVKDLDGRTLDQITDRTSCFSCHPGYDTQCLRGAMGKAIGDDGKNSMHCQSCHGSMAQVADPARVGWLDQPTCQNCHAGTATQNPGQIRYTDAYDAGGNLRTPTVDTFATDPDVPAPGFSLYRFSTGHGGLQCSACHGPPHAIYPTALPNDNAQSMMLQGHTGTISECATCHGNLEDDEMIGPHGMHPATNGWASNKHGDVAQNMGTAFCQTCHGSDNSGTVLSLTKADRSYNTEFGTKTFFKGSRIGCFACHNGPNSDNANSNQRPNVTSFAVATPNDQPLAIPLSGTDPNGDPVTLRIVDQPDFFHGTVAFDGSVATFLPRDDFVGTAQFSYAAWDGEIDSTLGVVTVTVGPPACAATVEPYGFGCEGSGGFVPQISLDGCPEAGGTITLNLTGGRGSAEAFILLGSARATTLLPGGCVIRVGAISDLFGPYVLSPGGFGDGMLSVSTTLPAVLPPTQLNVQVFIYDPGAGAIDWAASNAIEVLIP
ncbi:MAG: Ig-like domain-containing protein [Planctomycetota bacterium]